MSSPHNNNNNNDDDRSTGSANSTVSQFLRRIIPLNKWSNFFPSAASNLFGGNNENNNNENNNDNKNKNNENINKNNNENKNKITAPRQPKTANAQIDDPGIMLFDAVPFNGDTDNGTNSFTHNSSTLPDFSNVDIKIPLNHRIGSNISNISPIGNVSSRMLRIDDYNYNDCPSDESDDDLDRILGERAAVAVLGNHNRNHNNHNNHKQQQQQQQMMMMIGKMSGKALADSLYNSSSSTGELNRTMSTGHSGSSSLDCDEDAALGGCVFHSSGNSSSNHDDPRVPVVVVATKKEKDTAKRILSWPKERSIQIQKRYDHNHNNNNNNDDDGLCKGNCNCNGNLKDLFRTWSKWWIALCIVLILVISILIGALVPFSGARQSQSNNVDSSNSGVDDVDSSSPANISASLTAIPTKAPLVLSEPVATPTSQPSFLRPSMGGKPRPTLPPDVIFNAPSSTPPTVKVTDAFTTPSSAPTRKASAWSEDDENALLLDENENGNESVTLPQVRLDMGPMVGHTTHDSVTLWAYYVRPAIYLFEENYVLEILLYDSDGWVTSIDEVEPDWQRNNAVFATLTNLEALRMYRYEMRILGQMVGSGSFKTASAPPLPTTEGGGRNLQTTGTSFEYVLASCMDRSEQPIQNVWDAIPTINADGTKDYPDFAILAGDTIYLQEGIDIVDFWGVRFDRYWYRNREQRTEPHFAEFVANTPIYAVWNNHDYGAEVANMAQAGKEESLRAWKSLWPNPDYPGSSSSNNNNSNNGIYYSFYWGDVHYIVTDDHWNRDPFRENRWGTEQTDWITSELLSSRGTFKVIVLGSDILERGWSSDLENIGAVVTEHSINGVLFHAGDIHRNEYKRKPNSGGFPYPITQITSSGIAKVWRKPFAKIAVDTRVDDPMITVRFFGAATMEEDTTWTNDPDLVCSAIGGVDDREKEHSCTETIRLSDLSVAF
jgi:predicted MPP superfamily phosphohydrolase